MRTDAANRLIEIEREIARLEGERQAIIRFFPEVAEAAETPKSAEHNGKDKTAPTAPKFEKTPETAKQTKEILRLLKNKPGLTKLQVAAELSKGDKDLHRSYYNTAHSLARRKKIRREGDKLYLLDS